MTKAGLQVAIDGPAGAGKSTVARDVARRLGYVYIDTGAMYRAVTWLALTQKVDLADKQALSRLAAEADIRLVPGAKGQRTFINGQDVTEAIRLPVISRHVSPVSAVAGVREPMVRQQRRLAANGKVVMDGRDIGTNVLPEALVKIFLTASVAERARRRYLELVEKGLPVDLPELTTEIIRRDNYDASREVSPLVQAPDAFLLDTTGLTREAVVEQVLALVRKAEAAGHG
ncbi:MAG: (d)CMP kinase [Heliobacteriaceae bacterium]|nr:(d)CMP kinase [Heliobacteriaceae bacterium]MDD4587376.1 (d)CMP kinase [Heliobacteriaceae bacterium]